MSAFHTPKKIVTFRAKDGQVPVEEWLDELKDKRTQDRDIRLAKQYWQEYKASE